MHTVYIKRFESTDEGTFGYLSVPKLAYSCYTAELPWLDNTTAVSCIPTGVYECKLYDSPTHGRVFQLEGVVGRTNIQIHKGNYAGNVSKGFKTDSDGCILLGKNLGALSNQDVVLNSKTALNEFMSIMGKQPFKLIIA